MSSQGKEIGDYFYGCADCPEHSYKLNMNTGDIQDHCDLKGRNFTKSFPMRDTPCREMFEIAEYECPICGEVMDLAWSHKTPLFICKVHGEQKL